MLRSAVYYEKVIIDDSMKRMVSQYLKGNHYTTFMPAHAIILYTDPSGENLQSDINNDFNESYNKIKDALKITMNKVHNRFTFIYDLVLIDENTVKIIRYVSHKRAIRSEVIEIIPIDIFTDGYVYIGYNGDKCKVYTSYSQAYDVIYHPVNRYSILKVSINHKGSDYAFCSGDTQKDNEYYYDIEETLNRNNPIEYYDYCMQLIAGEFSYFEKGRLISQHWLELFCTKSYEDFLNPEYIPDMMSLKYPIECDKT